jgi:hypothetical protein
MCIVDDLPGFEATSGFCGQLEEHCLCGLNANLRWFNYLWNNTFSIQKSPTNHLWRVTMGRYQFQRNGMHSLSSLNVLELLNITEPSFSNISDIWLLCLPISCFHFPIQTPHSPLLHVEGLRIGDRAQSRLVTGSSLLRRHAYTYANHMYLDGTQSPT